jgi:hypothetical protein
MVLALVFQLLKNFLSYRLRLRSHIQKLVKALLPFENCILKATKKPDYVFCYLSSHFYYSLTFWYDVIYEAEIAVCNVNKQ